MSRRFVQLSAGTGNSYCGTCIRDNALVVELRRQGHAAMLVPLYLPLTLDEAQASPEAPLFFGGVNVYLDQKSPLFRKSPRPVRALLDSPRLLRAASRRAGMTHPRDLGDLTLSVLRGEHGHQVRELERLCDWLEAEVRPEIVCLSNLLFIGLARRIRERTGAAVLCFLNGEDAFLDGLPEPERTSAWEEIAARAADVDVFLPVSRYYGDRMLGRARLPAERVRVVYPGISVAAYGTAPPPEVPTLGYLAMMCPGKGLETLVRAYLLLREQAPTAGLRLRVAGSCPPAHREFVARMQAMLADAGAAGAAEFLPDLPGDRKVAFLQSLSVFSVPATYGESFGLYLIEAMAAGVPLVQPRHAAFPEVLESTGAGLLCDPDDPRSLAAAVGELLADPARARAMGEQGRSAARDRFTIERMAAEVMQAAGSAPEPSAAGPQSIETPHGI